jgi:hypothetical protein
MLRKLAATGVVATAAAGALMFSAPAYAGDGTDVRSSDGSVLSGNNVPIAVPINVCGNSLAVIGILGAENDADTRCVAVAEQEIEEHQEIED